MLFLSHGEVHSFFSDVIPLKGGLIKNWPGHWQALIVVYLHLQDKNEVIQLQEYSGLIRFSKQRIHLNMWRVCLFVLYFICISSVALSMNLCHPAETGHKYLLNVCRKVQNTEHHIHISSTQALSLAPKTLKLSRLPIFVFTGSICTSCQPNEN